MSEKKITDILNWLKIELEKSFSTQTSFLRKLRTPMMPGNSGYIFRYEDNFGLSIEIMYWDTGVIKFESSNFIINKEYITFWHLPDDYREKFYPSESEQILIKNANDLLNQLRAEKE